VSVRMEFAAAVHAAVTNIDRKDLFGIAATV